VQRDSEQHRLRQRNGTFNLQPPQHYSGKASASVFEPGGLEPLLRAFGNQSQLAGSLKLDWEGSGNAQAFKNTGNLKLVLEKARYGNLQGLQANIDASYSPRVLMCRSFFSRRPTWISMRSLGQG
jgi:hypothetical protein